MSERDPSGELPQPTEIERKFLINTLPDNLRDFQHESIRQGYLVIGAEGSEARLRDRNGAFTLTVKSKGELSRGEWETEITEQQFDTLWQSTAGKRVEKTRFLIPQDGLTIELDIYEGSLAGLVTAEVEFDSENASKTFDPPEWFGEDVTSVKAMKNQQLALNGLPIINT